MPDTIAITEKRLLGELDLLLNEVERQIKRSVSKLNQKDVREGLKVGERAALQQSLIVRAELRAILNEAGKLYVSEVKEGIIVVAQEIVENDPVLPSEFTANPAQAVEDVIERQIDELDQVFIDSGDLVRKGIMRATISGTSFDPVMDEIEKRMKITKEQAKVVVTTSVHASARTAMVEVAEDSGLDYVYRYTGPDDRVTRPFCRFYGFPEGPASKVAYTREALKALAKDPNQKKQPAGKTGDTRSYAGGWNCRHNWSPIPLFIAERDGFDIRGYDDVLALIRGGGSTVYGRTS